MKTWPAELAAALAGTRVTTRFAVWLEAVDTVDGLTRQYGWWTGDHELSLDLDGVTRTFAPIGGSLHHDDIEATNTLDVQRVRVAITSKLFDVTAVLDGLDLSASPFRAWRLVRDQAARNTWHATRLVSGWVDEVETTARTRSEDGTVSMIVATAAMATTWTLDDRRYNQATIKRRSELQTTGSTLATLTTDQTWTVPAVDGVIIEAVGGGGQASTDYGVTGGSGTQTTVEILDGGVVVETLTATGGAGGTGTQGTTPVGPGVCNPVPGNPSPLTPYGDGQGASCHYVGGEEPNPYCQCGNPGQAGGYVQYTIPDLSAYTTPQLRVTIGTAAPGGGAGAVKVSEIANGGDRFGRYASIAAEVTRQW